MNIGGKTQTESNYRAVNLDSSTSVKEFSLDRKKYYRKYILNEDVADKETLAANMGKLVETLLMEPHLFDEKFYMSSCLGEPTGLMSAFVEALYTHTIEAMNESGEVTRTFQDISMDAYNDSGFKIKYEAVLGKFIGSDAELYYNEIRQIRPKKLTVVTARDVTNAENIVEELKNNHVTSQIVNLTDSVRYKVLNQYQVEAYTLVGEWAEKANIDEHLFKSMLDKVIIDHKEKTIQPIDLKCTWTVENFYEEYYLYRRAYIQAYLYWHAINSLTAIGGEFEGYTVKLIQFLVCDSTNYMNPLIYQLSKQDMRDAEMGFEYKGRTYPGVIEIVQDLQWALENNIWNISRKNHLMNGVINLT
jgi:hypothetical protein